MAEEVLILNFSRKKGKLYYVSSDGDLVEMDAATKDKTVIPGSRVKKQRGYFYFLNKKGNIARVGMRNQSPYDHHAHKPVQPNAAEPQPRGKLYQLLG